MSDWEKSTEWEANWWGKCTSTCHYETIKQLTDYAPKMGLDVKWNSQGPHVDMQGKTILDIGGGPCSLLLLSDGYKKAFVVDPCNYPNWTVSRYNELGIILIKDKAENLLEIPEIKDLILDEILIYNVLQHVEDPKKIVMNARSLSKIIRVFDWLEIGIGEGHPWNLHQSQMDEWFGGEGKTQQSKGGLQYFGVFLGDHYDGQRPTPILSDENKLVDPAHTIEKNYEQWQNFNWEKGGWSPSKEWEINLIEYFTNIYIKKPCTILEIGVGNGRWTEYLQKKASHLIGVDLVESAIEKCTEKFGGYNNISLYKNDGKSLSFVKSKTIDFIWSFDTFVHISPNDVAEYLKEFSRVMKKNAIAIIHHGKSGNPEAWRSTLTDSMFDSFLKDNGLELIKRTETWGNDNQYRLTHKDSISIFTKR